TGFEVTMYADVAGTLFILPWSPALVRALPHAGTAARSGLCGRLRPGDPRIRHRRPLTDDPAEHGTAKRTLMPQRVRCNPFRLVGATRPGHLPPGAPRLAPRTTGRPPSSSSSWPG